MKISVENFKAIRKLQNFEIKPFTIISGVNSAGKSSLFQLLLILKQTIERNAADTPLLLDEGYYTVADFEDILHEKKKENKLKLVFTFNSDEINEGGENSIHNSLYSTEGAKLIVSFVFKNTDIKVVVENFSSVFTYKSEGASNPYIEFKHIEQKNYSFEAKSFLFVSSLLDPTLLTQQSVAKVDFLSFFPNVFEIIPTEDDNIKTSKEVLKLELVRSLFDNFFTKISYIGPLRREPKDIYQIRGKHNNVGKEGEFIAQILEARAEDSIIFFKIQNIENGISYHENTDTLLSATKYWMCDVFNVAQNIVAKKVGDNYRIELQRESGLSTSIKHVGFGISQLLPIVVEGLIMSAGGTLILEQPEIHLHPKLQSLLYDFLYSLTLKGKKVMVETHSSHFITRMRRRVAEDETNKMDDKINLTFIEGNSFNSLEIDDYGLLNHYPKDFIGDQDEELRAIVKAQMKKRLKD